MKLVNAYTVVPDDIEVGDVMCFVVKATVNWRDEDGNLRYRIYRCPWEGNPENIPQGSRVLNMPSVCQALFMSLHQVGKPG